MKIWAICAIWASTCAIGAWTTATLAAQSIEGIWYDVETDEYFEFSDTLSRDFIHHLAGGSTRTGVYRYLNTDSEGRQSYKVEWQGEEGKEIYIFRFNPDGQTGYRQYKCMKYPVYRRKDT
ncbi:MAG: hypothetical protein RMM53_06325 [Bacteroidia bacterium]|nr:hypothetical protein [Bacteroidia bacterium]MDW8333812.1 hypothetical protein [Bacteroidia bacterium]